MYTILGRGSPLVFTANIYFFINRYILVAKSRELAEMRQFTRSNELLGVVKNEARQNSNMPDSSITPQSRVQTSKLEKLVGWELLLVRIAQFHAEWISRDTSKFLSSSQLINTSSQIIKKIFKILKHRFHFHISCKLYSAVLYLDTCIFIIYLDTICVSLI